MIVERADDFDLERQGNDSPVSSMYVDRVQAVLAASCAFVVDESGDVSDAVEKFEPIVNITF